MIGILMKYSVYRRRPIPENPLEFLSHIPKNEMLVTVAKLNTLIQPRSYRSVDDSNKTQIECLTTILMPSVDNPTPEHVRKLEEYVIHCKSLPKNYILFTRSTCLYALNEILQTETLYEGEKFQYTFEERLGILDYLLVCNERILEFSENAAHEDLDSLGIDVFEFFAFSQIPHNQYSLNTNCLLKLYKSSYFLDVMLKDDLLGKHLRIYLKQNYGLGDANELFKMFMSVYLTMHDENLKIYHILFERSNESLVKIFQGFSGETKYGEVNHQDVKTLDFLAVKKNPIYSWEFYNATERVGFVVLDMVFLLEKFDSLFINDFWFDYIKPNRIMNRDDWGNFIGAKYFEPLAVDVLKNSFTSHKKYTIMSLNELEILLGKGKLKEIADLYIRSKQKIALVQAKGNYINMKDGLKSVTTSEDFLNLDLDDFYEKFGLNQMVETIKNFHEYKEHINDEGLDMNRKVHLFPIVLLNEPIISSGLFNFPLRRKFESMLLETDVELKNQHQIIWPLIILNIEEFQELEQSIKDGDVDFFRLLYSFHGKTDMKKGKVNLDKYRSLYTMHNIINEKVKNEKLFPQRLRNFELIFANND
jgi:hypothetical protein